MKQSVLNVIFTLFRSLNNKRETSESWFYFNVFIYLNHVLFNITDIKFNAVENLDILMFTVHSKTSM